MARTRFLNGKGGVTKLSGKRRKPYLVRSGASYFIDKDGNLKENRKIIGYAATKEEAYMMLTNYLQNPYDLDKSKITFSELYEEWYPSYFLGVSKSTQSFYKTAYSHCYALYNKTFKDIKLADYQLMFDEAVYSDGKLLSFDSLKRIKTFLGVLNKYALKNEIITKDYSQYIDIKRYKDRDQKKIDREMFNDKEIFMLWARQTNKSAQIVLCMIYTGLRVKKEFFNIKRKDVYLEEHYIYVPESKTKNGIRWVPIPDVIFPIVKEWYEDGSKSEYLFHTEYDNIIDYSTFRKSYWVPLMKELNMKHNPYDCRHTYNSILANAEVPTDIRERLMGHSSSNVNISVYTHFQKQKLLDVVNSTMKANKEKDEMVFDSEMAS